MKSNTRRALRSMGTGDLVRKVLRRFTSPVLLARDVRRLFIDFRTDLIRLYAAYHQKRKTPGRVFRIRQRNCRMWLPISYGETVAQRRFGTFEPWTFDTLDRIVRSGFVVVELGACYGAFTIHLSRLVGPKGRVYAFEPFPKYFEIAERNVALNALGNVRLLNLAVASPSISSVDFRADSISPYSGVEQITGLDYSGRLEDTKGVSTHSIATVQCVPLLKFLSNERYTMDLLFMDIEGGEINVLKNIRSLLCGEGKRPVVFFELHPQFYRSGDETWLYEFFEECGYSTERISSHLLCTPRS